MLARCSVLLIFSSESSRGTTPDGGSIHATARRSHANPSDARFAIGRVGTSPVPGDVVAVLLRLRAVMHIIVKFLRESAYVREVAQRNGRDTTRGRNQGEMFRQPSTVSRGKLDRGISR